MKVNDEKVSSANLCEFMMAMEKLDLQKSKLGKVWELRKVLFGTKTSKTQPASAITDPQTGNLVYTNEEIQKVTADHVKETLKDPDPIEKFKHVVAERNLKHFRFQKEEENLRMNYPKENFDLVLQKMKMVYKPCYRLLTKADEEYSDCIYKYFKKIVEEETLPKSFGNTTLTQLHKKGATNDLSNWRFIHMKTEIPRLFEATITELIKPKLLKAVSPYQLGGIPGNRPEQHLYTVKTILASRNSQGLPTFTSLFDMSKFFDRESAVDVMMTMHHIGCKGPAYRLLWKICEFNCLMVKTPAGKTKSFNVGAIIPQGSSYGAICSAVNLDTSMIKAFRRYLTSTMKELNVICQPLVFQDDILKLSGSKSEAQWQ